jgi:hypothetical protein
MNQQTPGGFSACTPTWAIRGDSEAMQCFGPQLINLRNRVVIKLTGNFAVGKLTTKFKPQNQQIGYLLRGAKG